MSADQKRLPVWHPYRSNEIAVHRPRRVLPVASRCQSHKGFVFVGAAAVTGKPIRDVFPVRREDAESFEFFMARQLPEFSARNIQYLHRAQIAVSRMGILLLLKDDDISFRGP